MAVEGVEGLGNPCGGGFNALFIVSGTNPDVKSVRISYGLINGMIPGVVDSQQEFSIGSSATHFFAEANLSDSASRLATSVEIRTGGSSTAFTTGNFGENGALPSTAYLYLGRAFTETVDGKEVLRINNFGSGNVEFAAQTSNYTRDASGADNLRISNAIVAIRTGSSL